MYNGRVMSKKNKVKHGDTREMTWHISCNKCKAKYDLDYRYNSPQNCSYCGSVNIELSLTVDE